MLVSRANGWTVDTTARTIRQTADGPVHALPDSTEGALVYFGLGYLESQAAARTVNDQFRKAWLEEARKTTPDVKAADVPKSAVPASDSPEYREALAAAHAALFDKLIAGYEVGVRDGIVDPVEEEADKIARAWLQGLAMQFKHNGKPWYTLPAKRKVARDEDAYDGPKYHTFGEALAAFKVSTSPAAGKLVGKTADGKAWPFKIKSGLTVADAIAAEAKRRVDERGEGRASVVLGVGDADEVVAY